MKTPRSGRKPSSCRCQDETERRVFDTQCEHGNAVWPTGGSCWVGWRQNKHWVYIGWLINCYVLWLKYNGLQQCSEATHCDWQPQWLRDFGVSLMKRTKQTWVVGLLYLPSDWKISSDHTSILRIRDGRYGPKVLSWSFLAFIAIKVTIKNIQKF